jgi:hypothetical protein
MPKGLAFLSKKSWHTSKLCNQEKVWIAEQEKQAEDIKIRELAKQIQQEREEEELHRISGKKSNRLDKGIDWMYQGGPKSDGNPTAFEEEQKQKEQEDYLMGKDFNPSSVKKGDLATAESSVGVNMVLTRAAEGTVVDSSLVEKERTERDDIQDWNSNFHLRHEDPMFSVEQQRKEIKEHNEKKQRLFERVDEEDESERGKRTDRDRADRKRSKSDKRRRSRHDRVNDDDDRDRCERKKHKKERKRESRRRSYSSESNGSRRDRRGRKHRHIKSRRHRSNSRSVSRSRSPGDNSRNGGHYDSRRRNRGSSRSRSRSSSRDRDGYKARHTESYSRRRSSDDKPSAYSSANEVEEKLSSVKKYGLVGESSSKPISTSDLGPDQALLEKKRKEKEDVRRGRSGLNSGGDRDNGGKRPISERERQNTLQEMQADASARSGHISNASRKSNAELYEEEIERRRDRSSGNNASFIQDATRKSHQLELSSRSSQNRDKYQRGKDNRFF